MKTLENQTLLYDKDCPLCKAYTSGFIKTGMLEDNGRKPFTSLTSTEKEFIDTKRACNEIALVNYKDKTVIYGIDSLLMVIGNSFPLIGKIGNNSPVKFLLKKLYSFISYNRKVIIPVAKTDEKSNQIQCVPDFNYRYRLAYIVFTALLTALVLFQYSGLVQVLPSGGFYRELLLAFGQLIFQALFLLKCDRKTILTYSGNLMTVSLMGSLLLLPILIVNHIWIIPQITILGWFGFVVMIMFIEHYRRVHLLKLPLYLCFTWVSYRMAALLIILNL